MAGLKRYWLYFSAWLFYPIGILLFTFPLVMAFMLCKVTNPVPLINPHLGDR